MRTRSLLVLLLLLLIAAFIAVNWTVITAPAKFSLLLTTVEAPLGLMMLGILVLIVAAFAIYLALWQGAVLAESRRQAKELQAQRALADTAEASRFTELSSLVRDEFTRLGNRVAQLNDGLRTEIRDNANSIAATIGELDDRMHGPGGAGS